MLGNLRISTKLMIMVGLSVLGIVAVAAAGLSALKNNLLDDRRAKLQDLVEVARQVLDRDHEAAVRIGLPEADMLARSKALLGSLRFGKDDYFYALEMDGMIAAHANPKMIGKNFINSPNSDSVRNMVELMKHGLSGFVSFRFPRASGDVPLPKLVYVTPYPRYNWGIVAGIYLDDVDTIFWSQV
jgi:methyl-accepting chemotaxis protein